MSYKAASNRKRTNGHEPKASYLPASPRQPDFDQVSSSFALSELQDGKALRRAARLLREVRTGGATERRWVWRAATMFAVPFPPNHMDEDARHELFFEASQLLLEMGDGSVVPELLAILGQGVAPGPQRQHKFIIDLVGRLGTPEDLPELLCWFNRQTQRTISSGSGFAAYAIMVNTLIRLQSPETLYLIESELRRSTAGELILSQHEHFMLEKARELILQRKPPKYGFSFLDA